MIDRSEQISPGDSLLDLRWQLPPSEINIEQRPVFTRQLVAEPLGRNPDRLFLPEDERERLDLRIGDRLVLRFGQAKKEISVAAAKAPRVAIKAGEEEKQRLRVSENIIKELGLPQDFKLRIKPERRTDGTLELKVGPILGIMSGSKMDTEPPLFPQRDLFRRLYQVGRAHGVLVYVFHPSQIDFKTGTVTAYIPDDPRNEVWTKVQVPLPDMVYDRSVLHRNRDFKQGEEVRKRLDQDPNIQFINGDAIRKLAKDKYDFYQTLARDPELRPYFPETRLLTTAADISHILDRYGSAIVKPRGGSASRGLFLIDKDGRDYVFKYHDYAHLAKTNEITSREERFTDLQAIIKRIQALNRVSGGDGNYIIQERRVQARHQGRLFEIRTSWQKGADQRWQLLVLTARVNSPKAMVGGFGDEFMPGAVVLMEKYGEGARNQLRTILSAAKKAALAMEAATQQSCADITVDFCFDEADKPFITEANTKPAHFHGLEKQEREFAIRHSNIIDYTLARTGFDIQSVETNRERTTKEQSGQKGRRILTEPLRSREALVYLSASDREHLGLSLKDRIRLRFGKSKTSAMTAEAVVEASNANQNWKISREVADSLNIGQLPEWVYVLSQWNSQLKELAFGPVVGILARQDQFGDGVSGEPFGDSTEELYDVIRHSARLGGLMYVFSPQSIDFSKGTVKAYLPQSIEEPSWKKVVWREVELPLPDVYWNRHFSKNPDQYRQARLVKERLRSVQVVPPVNSVEIGNLIGSKINFQEFMQADPELKRFSPETIVFRKPDDLETMLGKFRTVYVKPVFGTKGRGIVKCWKANGLYYYSYSGEKETVEGDARNLQLLIAKAGINLHRSYLCQEGIDLARHNGCIFDVRVLPQKRDARNWQITGMAARVAASPKSPTSNLHTGGHAEKVITVLGELFSPDKVTAIIQELHTATLLLAKKIDQKTSAPTMEIGVDFAIDVNGRPYILEANPMPGKQIFLDIGDKEARSNACSAPLSHIITRTGFIAI